MTTFDQYLSHQGVDKRLHDIFLSLSEVFPKVARALKGGQEGYSDSQNVYGEKQLKLDVYTNLLFEDVLKAHPWVGLIASEELEDVVAGQGGVEGYAVAYDPLDGSSLVDVNLAVGSIFGIYKGASFIGRKGSEQVAAIIVVYGPRLTFMVSVGKGVSEFVYDEEKKVFVLHQDQLVIAENKKMFAPGNLAACNTEDWYLKALNYWVSHDYKLRYSGGMVPDVNQILKKGGGIFTYPGSAKAPEGKLRLLYECAPMAYLIEQAGGMAVNGSRRILDIVVEKLDHRTPIFLGSKIEVETILKFL